MLSKLVSSITLVVILKVKPVGDMIWKSLNLTWRMTGTNTIRKLVRH